MKNKTQISKSMRADAGSFTVGGLGLRKRKPRSDLGGKRPAAMGPREVTEPPEPPFPGYRSNPSSWYRTMPQTADLQHLGYRHLRTKRWLKPWENTCRGSLSVMTGGTSVSSLTTISHYEDCQGQSRCAVSIYGLNEWKNQR